MQQESVALLLLFCKGQGEQEQAARWADAMIAIAPEVRVPRGTLPRRELRSFAQQACTAIPLAGEVSVLLTTDEAIQQLNRQYRRKNKATDVLSFPAAETGTPGRVPLAGDLAISVDTAARQADEFGHSLLLEIKVLLLHGLLHLAGFDHEQDAGEMRRREAQLRRRFELPAGLIQRAAAPRPAPACGAKRPAAR